MALVDRGLRCAASPANGCDASGIQDCGHGNVPKAGPLGSMFDLALEQLDLIGRQGEEVIHAVAQFGAGMGIRGGAVRHIRATSSGVRS